MSERSPDYHAFLLRLWREPNTVVWRVTLREATTGAQKAFADLPAVYAYLAHLTRPVAPPVGDDQPLETAED